MSGAAMNNTGGKTLLGNFVEEVSNVLYRAFPDGWREMKDCIQTHAGNLRASTCCCHG